MDPSPLPVASAVGYTSDDAGPRPTTGRRSRAADVAFSSLLPRARVVQSALALINPRSPPDPLTVAPLTITEEVAPPASRNICGPLRSHRGTSKPCRAKRSTSLSELKQRHRRALPELTPTPLVLNIFPSEISRR